jgi:exosortase
MSAALQRKLYKPVAIAAALGFVYLSVLLKLGRDWWHDENYSHGLLIPFVIAFMLWQDRDRLTKVNQPSTVFGAIGISISVLMLWAGTAGAELFMQRISLITMLVSVVIYFFGARLLQFMIVPLGLLLLSIPIPQIVFNRVAFPLQLFASRCAVSAMSLFSIPVLRQGNVIELMPYGASQPKRLAVVEACSGIRSLMTLITLAVIYAYFTKAKPPQSSDGDKPRQARLRDTFKGFNFWRALILVASAVPIAILTNAARVSGTGILAHYYGSRMADGFFHSFSGWVVYVAAAVLLFATAWILDHAKPLVERLFRRGLSPAWPGNRPALNELELSK